MSVAHRAEDALAGVLAGLMGALPLPAARALGATLGDLTHALGVRRAVARDNLRIAFPDKSNHERDMILAAHYRELGRTLVEYPRLAALARAPLGEVIAEAHGLEHIDALHATGRGAILLGGHFGAIELFGAFLAQRHPTDFVVRALSNPYVEARLHRARAAAGVGQIPSGAGIRRVFESLQAGRWVAMLADQDARRHGVFVPFFGRPTSTPTGPARIALATGLPIVMGFAWRRPDGRHAIEVEAPLAVPDGPRAAAIEQLTALHAAHLEAWIRRHPEQWFWLHRRWKSTPPAATSQAP